VNSIITLPESRAFNAKEIACICRGGGHGKAKRQQQRQHCIRKNVAIDVIMLTDQKLKEKLEKCSSSAKLLPLKDNLPKVVKYLKKNIRLQDVNMILQQFEEASVTIPVEAIAQEFRNEGVELNNITKSK